MYNLLVTILKVFNNKKLHDTKIIIAPPENKLKTPNIGKYFVDQNFGLFIK